MRPIENVAWNLFLAVVPMALAFAISYGVHRDKRRDLPLHRAFWIFWLLIWLIFLPNTCYLVTEWRHFLTELLRNPAKYEGAVHDRREFLDFLMLTAFYVFYSGSGLILFCLAVWPLDQLTRPPWTLRGLFFGLCALGVYLGLVLRLNSWQVVTHPQRILEAVLDTLRHPHLLLLIVVFALVLWAFYSVFSLTMDGARLRYRALRAK